MIWQAVLITAVSFVYVGAKAFQQLNVMHDCRSLVPIFTVVMAVCEVVIVGNIALKVTQGGWLGIVVTIVAMTVGSSAGALVSMALHKRMRKMKG